MKKTQAEELNLACHSSLGFETFSEISSVKQSSGPPRREAGMGCGFPLYREAFSQLSQHLLHKGAGSGPGTWVRFAQPTERQVGWNPASHSPTKAKCSRGEFIPLGQSRVSGQNCCPWWQMLSPWGWGLGNVGTALGEIPLPAEHGVTQVLSADSCSPFGGGWMSLLWPRTSPAVPKLQTLTSSCASQCVLQSSPPSRITASASLTAFFFQSSCSCLLSPSLWGCYLGVFLESPGGDYLQTYSLWQLCGLTHSTDRKRSTRRFWNKIWSTGRAQSIPAAESPSQHEESY